MSCTSGSQAPGRASLCQACLSAVSCSQVEYSSIAQQLQHDNSSSRSSAAAAAAAAAAGRFDPKDLSNCERPIAKTRPYTRRAAGPEASEAVSGGGVKASWNGMASVGREHYPDVLSSAFSACVLDFTELARENCKTTTMGVSSHPI